MSSADLLDLTRARCCERDRHPQVDRERRYGVGKIRAGLSPAVADAAVRWASKPSEPAPGNAHRNFHRADLGLRLRTADALLQPVVRQRRTLSPCRAQGRHHRAKSRREHRELMEATVARDADKACRLISQHFERTAQLCGKCSAGDVSSSQRRAGMSQNNAASYECHRRLWPRRRDPSQSVVAIRLDHRIIGSSRRFMTSRGRSPSTMRCCACSRPAASRTSWRRHRAASGDALSRRRPRHHQDSIRCRRLPAWLGADGDHGAARRRTLSARSVSTGRRIFFCRRVPSTSNRMPTVS